MYKSTASIEMFRWGFAHLPGVIIHYAAELDLDVEDIGLLTIIFYAYENSNPFSGIGLKVGQIIKSCPAYTSNKLSRKLNKLQDMELITINDEGQRLFSERVIFLEPFYEKLTALIARDHSYINNTPTSQMTNNIEQEQEIEQYKQKIYALEQELIKQNSININHDYYENVNADYKKVADFISQKTGNLLSLKMGNELKKWLQEMNFTVAFLLCMLELCFERNIVNPREITGIACDLKEYSINSVEGLELYFKNYVDKEKKNIINLDFFNADIIEFGRFTGIDMTANARKKVYNKWRYDWAFSHQLIMKAGELMCQRTHNGGMEYIDSVLSNWKAKSITSLEEAEKEISSFKAKNKSEKKVPNSKSKKSNIEDYNIYVPPEVISELKNTL